MSINVVQCWLCRFIWYSSFRAPIIHPHPILTWYFVDERGKIAPGNWNKQTIGLEILRLNDLLLGWCDKPNWAQSKQFYMALMRNIVNTQTDTYILPEKANRAYCPKWRMCVFILSFCVPSPRSTIARFHPNDVPPNFREYYYYLSDGNKLELLHHSTATTMPATRRILENSLNWNGAFHKWIGAP